MDPIGLAEIKADIAFVVAAWQSAPFDQVIMGKNYDPFCDACAELKKKVVNAQRNGVKLDTKVKKWVGVPTEVSSEVNIWRQKAHTILNCF